MFNSTFYEQSDNVAIGSPLGLALANILMSSLKNKLLKDYPDSLKPFIYRRYDDNVFV